MKNRGIGLVLALATAAFTACAAGGAGTGTGVAGDPGGNTHTRAADEQLARAQLQMGRDSVAARGHLEQALEHATRSIETEPENPRGYVAAGQAYMGLGDWVGADSMYTRAAEVDPAFTADYAQDRWISAYNLGIERVNAGDLEGGLELFQAAERYDPGRPEALMNIGWTHMQLGNTNRAAESYLDAVEALNDVPEELTAEQREAWNENRRVATLNAAEMLAQSGQYQRAADLLADVLIQGQGTMDPALQLQLQTAQASFLAQAGEAERAEALFEQILTRGDLTAHDYFQIGIGLFNTGDFARAAEAFQTSAERNPYSRDALFNLVQAQFSQAEELREQPQSAARDAQLREIYTSMASTAHRVREFDPLNQNLLSFMLQAYRGLANLSSGAQAQQYNQESQQIFRSYQEQQFAVSDISLSMQRENRVEIGGLLRNLSATPGSQVQLRFSILGPSGQEVESEMIRLDAPQQDQAVEFSTQMRVPENFAGWKYEIVR